MDNYILNGHDPVPEPQIKKWAEWFEHSNRTVRATIWVTDSKCFAELERNPKRPPNSILISTVFLGIDHGWGQKPPILFETMVFGLDGNDEYQTRCATWDEAEVMHEKAIEYVKGKL